MQDTFTLAEKFISLVCNSDKPEPKLLIDEFFIYENMKNYRWTIVAMVFYFSQNCSI